MPIRFDPYHKWLGIPLEEQPPHHYRLLGLQSFETDADAIGNAADQRMRYLKTFATSNHAAMAEDMLDQVAKARVCLLNPTKKQAYDVQLGARLSGDTGVSHVPDGICSPVFDGMTSSLDVLCPHCENEVKCPLSPTSQIISCGHCRKQFRVPGRNDFKQSFPSPVPAKTQAHIEQSVDSPSNFIGPSRTDSINELFLGNLTSRSGSGKKRRPKRQRHPLWTLAQIVFGGLGGIALVLWVGPKVIPGFPNFESSEKPPATPPAVNNPSPQSRIARGRDPRGNQPQPVQPPRPTKNELHKLLIAAEPAMEDAKPNINQGQPELQPVVLDESPAVVKMTLTKSLIRVVATPENIPVGNVLCDIQFSENLGGRPPNGLAIVPAVTGLSRNQSKEILFEHGSADVKIGVEVKFSNTATAAVVELRPKFALPSGYEGPFTRANGTRMKNQLSKDLARANEASTALPNLRSQLSQARSQYQTAVNLRQPTEALRLQQIVATLERQVAQAIKLEADRPRIENDLKAIADVEEYGRRIIDVGEISIRLYFGNETLKAEVR